ncbi:hypothetical protein ABH909_002700 [Pseudomonas sp. BS3782 TE3695]
MDCSGLFAGKPALTGDWCQAQMMQTPPISVGARLARDSNLADAIVSPPKQKRQPHRAAVLFTPLSITHARRESISLASLF